jgi:hypothetical protein
MSLDTILGIPKEIREIIRAYGKSRYLELLEEELTQEEYWPEHKRVLDVLYERLAENKKFILKDVSKKQCHSATKALLEVMNLRNVSKPIKPVDKGGEPTITLGRAWEIYLFDGHTVLKDGDRVVIDSGKPAGKTEFEVEIVKSEKPFSETIYENYDDEILIEMDITYVRKLFGPKDTKGEKVEKDKTGYFSYKISRVGIPKEEKVERVGG